MVFPFFRSGFNYDRDVASDESGLKCEDVSLAKQSFAEEVDINTIIRRFGLSGQLPENLRVPSYGDFEGIFDFHSAMDVVARAREAFDELPGLVRARFHNDPAELVDFVADEKNRDEAVKMGIVPPKVVAPVVPVVVPVVVDKVS